MDQCQQFVGFSIYLPDHMASHPNTAICERNTHTVHKKQWSQCFNGNVWWQWLWRLCCRRLQVMAQEMFWRRLHLKASQYHPICDMPVILEICKSIVLHVLQITIYIYIYICIYTWTYCVVYCLYFVFELFCLCIFILICFVCTSVRTTATEWQLNCSFVVVVAAVIIILYILYI